MVKREADVKMQKIAQRFDKRGHDAYKRSVMAELEQEERRRHLQEHMRLQDIQKVENCLFIWQEEVVNNQITYPLVNEATFLC